MALSGFERRPRYANCDCIVVSARLVALDSGYGMGIRRCAMTASMAAETDLDKVPSVMCRETVSQNALDK